MDCAFRFPGALASGWVWPMGSPSRRSEWGKKGRLGLYSIGFLSVRSPGVAGSLHRRTLLLSRRPSLQTLSFQVPAPYLVTLTPSHLAVVTALPSQRLLRHPLGSPHTPQGLYKQTLLNHPHLRVLFLDGIHTDPHWTKSIILGDNGEIFNMK